jgi:hypothetical protein
VQPPAVSSPTAAPGLPGIEELGHNPTDAAHQRFGLIRGTRGDRLLAARPGTAQGLTT